MDYQKIYDDFIKDRRADESRLRDSGISLKGIIFCLRAWAAQMTRTTSSVCRTEIITSRTAVLQKYTAA